VIRDFGYQEIWFLLLSTGWTIALTLVASLFGGIIGLVVALGRCSSSPIARELTRGYVALVQGVPVLIVLFLTYYGLAHAGIELPTFVAAGLSLSVYAGAYLGDIWRGAIQSVPRHQWEASASLAMTRRQQYRHVILPQSIRIALPPTVGFLVQLVKNTSIVSIIGVVERTRAGQLVNNVTFQPFKVFLVVAFIYLTICYPMSRMSRRVEGNFRVHRSR
jgi:polar amino acid transport system permease protein